MKNLPEMIKAIFLYPGCKNEKEYEKIMINIHNNNKQILRAITFIVSTVTALLMLLAFSGIIYKGYCMNHLLIFTFSFPIYILTLIIKKPNSKILNILIYLFLSVIYLFGIINGTCLSPNRLAVSMVAMLLGLPIFFIDRPIKIFIMQLLAIIGFISSDYMIKPRSLLEYDVINVLVFGFIGMYLGYRITKIHVAKYIAENRLRDMSEYDSLTGIRNRNSYENNLNLYPQKINHSIACIYFDANGLHDLNNTKGHKAGDKMLCFIADTLVDFFGKDDAYRIGGDEFVVFVTDSPTSSIKDKLAEFTKVIKKASYNVSWGLYEQKSKNINMTNLIINAERKMYHAKAIYYRQHGIDRRKHNNNH